MEDCLKIIVAGEVDSGKSTLIGRFLHSMGSVSEETMQEIGAVCQRLDRDFEFAYLLDSLEEERRDQLTMDTAQIFCKNKNGKEFLFIDVPGHRELLKNMLCGSSYGNAAILTMDIEKLIKEGTKRHISVLKFLGINNIIIALNKMDLVNFEKTVFEEADRKISIFLKEIGLQPKFCIPISAKKGENLVVKSKAMSWHNGLSLLEALLILDKEIKKERCSDFYFPIQDVYDVKGEKIYAGTIISGRIKKGEMVKVSPSNTTYRVKSIKLFDKFKSYADVKESIGMIFAGSNNLERGQIAYKTNPPEITTEIKARIFCIKPFNINNILRFRCITQEVEAKIKKIYNILDTATLEFKENSDNIDDSNIAEVSIFVERPVAVKKFHQVNNLGRFVLRQNKEICAAGIII